MQARRRGAPSQLADNQRIPGATIAGEFHDRRALNRAVRELMSQSVPADSIQVFVRSADGRRRQVSVEAEAGVLRGALVGAGTGAASGVLIVVLLVAGVFGEPGVGLLEVRGIAGAVRVVLLTAAAAVPLGALLGMGRWRSEAISDRDLAEGRAEVVVTSEELEPRAREILERAGAVRISGA